MATVAKSGYIVPRKRKNREGSTLFHLSTTKTLPSCSLLLRHELVHNLIFRHNPKRHATHDEDILPISIVWITRQDATSTKELFRPRPQEQAGSAATKRDVESQ